MWRDKTRQIPHSKLPRPIYDVLTQSSNVLTDSTCCVATRRPVYTLFTVPPPSNSSSARALCGIGIAAYVATFLVDIFHLSLSRLYLASLEKASPIQTWPAGRLRSRELEDTLQTRMGDMNEMIPDRRCSIWFSNKAEPGTSIRGAFEFLGGAQITLCVWSVIACSCWRSLKGNRVLMCVVLSVSLSLSKSITFSKEGRGWKVGDTVTCLLFATRLITKWICWMQNKHIFLRSNLPI